MRYGGADRSPPRRTSTPLLDLDLGAGRLELLLELVGLRLGDATLDLLGGGLDEVLRLLEAEARDDADLLDDVDLVRAGVGEDDGELRLLLHWRGGGGGPATGDHHRRGGRDAPLLLELLDQVRRLHDGERGELVDDRVQVCHVLSRFLFVPGAPAPGVFTYRGLLLPELILAGVQDLASCWPGVASIRAILIAGCAMTLAIAARSSWMPGILASACTPFASMTCPSITAVRIANFSRSLAKSTRIFAGATTSPYDMMSAVGPTNLSASFSTGVPLAAR